jgi:plasmid stability protein
MPKQQAYYAAISLFLFLSLPCAAEQRASYQAASELPLAEGDGDEPPAEANARVLLAKLKRSKPGSQEYVQLAEKLLASGPESAEQLLTIIRRDANRLEQQYLAQLGREASRVLKSRWTRRTAARAKHLRQSILQNAMRANLTKDQIVAISDPAREKLNELYVDNAAELLEGDEDLRTQRQGILALADLASQAWQELPAERQKKGDAPPSSGQADALLQFEEEYAILLASPMPARDRAVIRQNHTLAENLLPAEARGVLLLNRLRTRLGLGALKIDLRVQAAAHGHSADMAEHQFFSHTSPLPGKTTLADRGKRAGAAIHGENIQMGSEDPAAALRDWWYSPGHHVNLLRPEFRRVGVGYHELHWTQNFGR